MAKTAVERSQALVWHRVAVALMFFISGAMFANWAARIPDVQAHIGLDKAGLGLALLGMSVGVLTALPLAGGLISRFSSRVVTGVSVVAMCVIMPLLGVVGSFWGLWLVLVFFGVSHSTLDVAMNAQAVEVERQHGQPIMSSFHAAFSVGTAIGAAMGAVFAGREADVFAHFAAAALFFGMTGVVAIFGLIFVNGERQQRGAVFSLPPRPLWLLGLVAFCAAIAEGSMADWSALYLREVVQVSAGFAGLGFTAFAITMTIGRISGDWLTARFDPEQVVRYSGIIGAAGLALAILVPTLPAALTGFALVGFGAAVVIPLAFSVAGNRTDVSPGVGIAGVATIGYAGFLAGPPAIGMVAETTSLRAGLGIVLVLFVVMAFNAHALRRPPQPESEPGTEGLSSQSARP